MTPSDSATNSNLTAIAEYTETAAGLAELRQRHQGVVYDVTVPKEMRAAKEARAELRTLRTDLEKRRTDIKAPALERCRLIDAEAKRLTAEIRTLEEPIDVQIKAEESRKQAEELARLEAERQRVEGIARTIEEIRNMPSALIGKPAVIIEGQLAKLRERVLEPEFFAERLREAQDALAATIAHVESQLQAQHEHETEQRRIVAERAELERMRAENERLQREAQERAAEDRQREKIRVDTIRDKINGLSFVPPIANQSVDSIDKYIADRMKSDPRDADNTFDFVEFQNEACEAFDKAISHLHEIRRAAVQRQHKEYEVSERRAKEERQLQAERERQAEEQRQLEAERAELEQQRREAAAKAKRERLANLGLREAAQAVVDYFLHHQVGEVPKVVHDLSAALSNDVKAAQLKANIAAHPLSTRTMKAAQA